MGLQLYLICHSLPDNTAVQVGAYFQLACQAKKVSEGRFSEEYVIGLDHRMRPMISSSPQSPISSVGGTSHSRGARWVPDATMPSSGEASF
jgi:hypothetical protein